MRRVRRPGRCRRARGERGGHRRARHDARRQPGSVDLAYDEAMFEPGSLVPCVGKQVQVASGALLSATHIGTLLLVARDMDGVWRALRRPGAWLVPGLQMNLLSVRAGKLLGARAPDFDALRVYGTRGEVFPMLDVKPDYVLDSRVLADVLADTAQVKSYLPDDGAEKADAAIARGRNPIQFGTLSDSDAAGIISEIFGGRAPTPSAAPSAWPTASRTSARRRSCGASPTSPPTSRPTCSRRRRRRPTSSRATSRALCSPTCRAPTRCARSARSAARYSVSFLDGERDYAGVYFLKNKKPASVIGALKKFLAECRALDPTYRIRVLRTDRGSEYLNSEMDDFAGAEGFVQSPGAAYHRTTRAPSRSGARSTGSCAAARGATRAQRRSGPTSPSRPLSCATCTTGAAASPRLSACRASSPRSRPSGRSGAAPW